MGHDCDGCQHFRNTEWSVLSCTDSERMAAGRRDLAFLAGGPIYHEGDEPNGVYCIDAGLVGIRKVDAQGESVLLRLVRAGETFGFRAMICDSPRLVSAEALTESRICRVHQAAARRLVLENPKLGFKFFNHLAIDLQRTESKVLETATAPSRLRFLRLLIVFGKAHQCDEVFGIDAPWYFDLPLSRQDIASMIGVRPESMSRIIRGVKQEGLANFEGRTVEIPDPRLLGKESKGESLF